MNSIKEKVLLLLLAGVALGCSYSYRQQWRVLKTVSKEWKKFNREKLRKEVNDLYRIKYINKKDNSDGSVDIIITEKGKLKALNIQLNNIKNQTKKWDGKWRMVAFDVPESYKKRRDALRQRLKTIGFKELQKSVFVTHFDCIKEIALFVNFFKLGNYIRFGILEFIDNEDYLKKIFKL